MNIRIKRLADAAMRLLSPKAVGARAYVAMAVVIVSLGLLTGAVLWPRSPVDLADANKATRARLFSNWDKGNVVMLIRHGERCDRSNNPCFGPVEGITQQGQAVATEVGKSLSKLGLGNSDVIASPAIRTMQTAQFMVGHAVPTEEWLSYCDKKLFEQVLSQKVSQRNLVLVTHSGCISQLESDQGYEYAESSEYNSALIITLDAQGKPTIVGVLNPEDWPRLVRRR